MGSTLMRQISCKSCIFVHSFSLLRAFGRRCVWSQEVPVVRALQVRGVCVSGGEGDGGCVFTAFLIPVAIPLSAAGGGFGMSMDKRYAYMLS